MLRDFGTGASSPISRPSKRAFLRSPFSSKVSGMGQTSFGSPPSSWNRLWENLSFPFE